MTSSASSLDSRASAISCGSAIAGRPRSEDLTPSVTAGAYSERRVRSTAVRLLVVQDGVLGDRCGRRDRPLLRLVAGHLEGEVERRMSDRDVELPVTALVGMRAELTAAVGADPDADV